MLRTIWCSELSDVSFLHQFHCLSFERIFFGIVLSLCLILKKKFSVKVSVSFSSIFDLLNHYLKKKFLVKIGICFSIIFDLLNHYTINVLFQQWVLSYS